MLVSEPASENARIGTTFLVISTSARRSSGEAAAGPNSPLAIIIAETRASMMFLYSDTDRPANTPVRALSKRPSS